MPPSTSTRPPARPSTTDDLALLKFGERMILQIMFGEESITKKGDAYESLVARRQQQRNLRAELAENAPASSTPTTPASA